MFISLHLSLLYLYWLTCRQKQGNAIYGVRTAISINIYHTKLCNIQMYMLLLDVLNSYSKTRHRLSSNRRNYMDFSEFCFE